MTATAWEWGQGAEAPRCVHLSEPELPDPPAPYGRRRPVPRPDQLSDAVAGWQLVLPDVDVRSVGEPDVSVPEHLTWSVKGGHDQPVTAMGRTFLLGSVAVPTDNRWAVRLLAGRNVMVIFTRTAFARRMR